MQATGQAPFPALSCIHTNIIIGTNTNISHTGPVARAGARCRPDLKVAGARVSGCQADIPNSKNAALKYPYFPENKADVGRLEFLKSSFEELAWSAL